MATTYPVIQTKNEKVGIGTTSPEKTLQLGKSDGTNEGSLRIYHDGSGEYVDYNGYGMVFNRDSNYIRPTAAGKTMFFGTSSSSQTWQEIQNHAGEHNWYIYGSFLMRLNSTGLGIGTSSPTDLLVVHKDSTSGQFVTHRNNTGFFLNRTYADYNNDGTTVEYQERVGVDGNYASAGLFSNHEFQLRQNNQSRLALLTSGNIYIPNSLGIGTTDPKAELNVVGSILLAREHGVTQLNNNKDWANMQSGIIWREYNHSLSTHPTTSDAMTEMIKGATFTEQNTISNVDGFTRSDETYVVEFLGYYYATSNDTYSFSISSDDAGDIFIDGTRVADWYGGHGDNNSATGGSGQNTGSIYLVKGFHKIYARYEEIGGGDSASLWHKIGSGSWEKIPANRLYHKAEDLFRATGSGNVTLTGTFTATADIVAYSDKRIKDNVETIDNALDKVQQLRGVSFNRIKDGSKSIGVIAQEIEKVLPEVVTEDDKGIKGVAYGNVVGVLIEAIKEQQKQIDELKARLDGSTK